jgi:hypothetical protein
MCIVCGVRQPRSAFSSDAVEMAGGESLGHGQCDRCLAKQHVAESNVYFKFPVLNYKACPFSTDAFRDKIKRKSSFASQDEKY